MERLKIDSSNFWRKIKKLNKHTHIKIPAQFLRMILMLTFSFLMIAVIASADSERNAGEKFKLEEKLEMTVTQLKTESRMKNHYILEYKSVVYSNKEQEDTIKNLEGEVAELRNQLYQLKHPQKAYTYTSEELEWLAKLINQEAGCNSCTDRHQQLIAAVVLCRVNSKNWPNSIKEVISQSGQYGSYNTWDWNNNAVPQRAYDNALAVLNGTCDYPDNLIFQSSFPQKSWGAKEYNIYETYYTKETGTTTYFCLGN